MKIWIKNICFPLLAIFAIVYSSVSCASSDNLKGYDVVSYFKKKPVKGSKEYSTNYKGATYYFESSENLSEFKSNPDSFLPEYGGYCAYAMAKKTVANSSPLIYSFYEGKLYLNYSEKIREKWLKDKEGHIKQGDKYWKSKKAP